MLEHMLSEFHAGTAGGHLEHDKAFRKIRETFFWPGYSDSQGVVSNKFKVMLQRMPTKKMKTITKHLYLYRW